jgi:hypothetical protein
MSIFKKSSTEREYEATRPEVLTAAALLLVSWLTETGHSSVPDQKKCGNDDKTVESLQADESDRRDSPTTPV